ncbi:MAG: sulfatase [Rubritalea sp.]|uniref:sulfatase n=1 Tax=Rubritalea sp. TaxID=2109375 RepID=UPI003241D740
MNKNFSKMAMATITVSVAVLSGATSAVAAPKPNIVHILIDDLGWQDVACYYRTHHKNEPFYETPNMDRLAESGIRFMQAYSPAMTCAPSRAAYMTGQVTPHNGVYHVNMGGRIPRARKDDRPQIDPYYFARVMPGKPAIPKMLKQAGYTTAHVGKWHISGTGYNPGPLDLGFDFSFDKEHKYNDPEIYDANDRKQANFSGLFLQPKNRLKDAFTDPRFPLLEDDRPYDSMTDLSQRWISKVSKKDKPFFLNLCPSLVHGPVMTRDKKRLTHYCEKLGIPFPTDQGSISDPDKPGQHNPYYASMVDSVDWIVGQIITTLEETDDARNPGHKLIDNTYVFVSSDNGASQNLGNWKSSDGKLRREKVSDNAPLRQGKGWAYEGGCRIPFIVMGPGIKPGSINRETPINLIDLFPTFMGIAGLENDGSLDIDGCDIFPVIMGQEKVAKFHEGAPRDTLYFHYPVLRGAFSTIQRDNWKLMKNTGIHENGAPEIQLFNLSEDLSEKINLVEKHPEKARMLQADLESWLEKYDAGVPYNNADYKKGDLPGQGSVPAVISRGSENDNVWASFETGARKAKVVKAFFLYSVNGYVRSPDEEWFLAPAELLDDKVVATVQPGMTHGIFCLIDENNFLIYSEPVPTMQEIGTFKAMAFTLKDGFAYKPGLFSLIQLSESALKGLKDQDTAALESSLQAAKGVYAHSVEEKTYATAIRNLRRELAKFKGVVDEADRDCLHYFPRD